MENVLTKAAIQAKSDIITDETVDELLPENLDKETETIRDVFEKPGSEKDRIFQVLNDVQWHYGRACERLGISRPTLKKRMKTYNILAKPRRKKTP